MKNTRSNTKIGNALGRLGEDIAAKFLESRHFKIVERNYRKPWGEIDLVAQKDAELHFIEVKSVSREIPDGIVTYETPDHYRAEDNVHARKLKRLQRVIQTYILNTHVSREMSWRFDVLTVYIDEARKTAAVKPIFDLTL